MVGVCVHADLWGGVRLLGPGGGAPSGEPGPPSGEGRGQVHEVGFRVIA